MVLALTALLAAVALTLLGLAVPVTASFVIGWVIIGPALLDLGVTAPAAAMFVFYFAVLSEASPPTALAAVAAAAVTGGRLVPTMWQTLRYALPAYLTPLAFVVTPTGLGLLGIGASSGSPSPRRSPRSASPCSPSPPVALHVLEPLRRPEPLQSPSRSNAGCREWRKTPEARIGVNLSQADRDRAACDRRSLGHDKIDHDRTGGS